MKPRIAVCAVQVPFAHGGAEVLCETLRDELARRDFDAEIVSLPFAWGSRVQIAQSALAWRLVDLERAGGRPIDLVIGTRFPSYLARHPNKVVWLIHQFRQAYDLLGTSYSDFAKTPEDGQALAMIHGMDRVGLGEARARFAISENVAARLRRFNELDAEALYPPPKLGRRYRSEPLGDYVFTVGRLDPLKRFDQLVRALPHCASPVRCVIAGDGPEADRLAALAAELGLGARVELPGRIEDERLLSLYAGALAVFYAPHDEDYGYVTVEAFRSRRPMITTADAGGVLEFVADGVNGLVCAPGAPRELAAAIDRLFVDHALAQRFGEAGHRRVEAIDWDDVVSRLTARL